MADAILHATHPVLAQLSQEQLTFDPECGSVRFVVTVHNKGDRFASFKLSLLAAGSDAKRGPEWYRLVPSVSSKIPVGDRTQFFVEIFDVPPLAGNFTGTINVTARVFSPELQEEDRRDLRLIIEGSSLLPPELALQDRQLQSFPEERFEVKATLTNPNRKSLTTQLQLRGLNPSWLPNGSQKSLTLDPSERREISFICEVPEPIQTAAGNYSVELRASHPQTATVSKELVLKLLPKGYATFGATPLEQSLPPRSARWLNPTQATATYELSFENQSNAELRGQVQVISKKQQSWLSRTLGRSRLFGGLSNEKLDSEQLVQGDRAESTLETYSKTAPEASVEPALEGSSSSSSPIQTQAPTELEQNKLNPPTETILPIGETVSIPLAVTRKLPWIGPPRLENLEARATLVDAELDLRDEIQTLQLQLLPIISLRLQLLLAVLSLLLATVLLGFLGRRNHTQPVYTVQFNGQGSEVISASADQTIRHWQVRGKKLSPKGVLTQFDKAVRNVNYRPVDNNQVVAALENGNIQKLDLLTGRFQPLLLPGEDDRVFDTVFTRDARTLYSGHGSGLIWQWPLTPASNQLGQAGQSGQQARSLTKVDFAIRALSLAGSGETHLAIAGRYAELQLLELAEPGRNSANRSLSAPAAGNTASPGDSRIRLPYPSGGSEAYIMDLATAEQNPALLATADNQGLVTLWNVDQCLAQLGNCEPLEQWSAHGGEAVNAVALSADGCYLASAGDDGHMRLWPLTERGRRQPQVKAGRSLAKSGDRLNAVDIIQQLDQLSVVSGGDDHQVRLRSIGIKSNSASSNCPGLS